MICPKCGKEIQDNQKFCNFCGSKIEIQPAQPVVSAQPAQAASVQTGNKEKDFTKVSFVLAIIGSALTYFSIPIVSLFAGTPLGVIALCMSSIDLYNAKQDGKRADSKVIATFVLGLIVALFFIMSAVASTTSGSSAASNLFSGLLGGMLGSGRY